MVPGSELIKRLEDVLPAEAPLITVAVSEEVAQLKTLQDLLPDDSNGAAMPSDLWLARVSL